MEYKGLREDKQPIFDATTEELFLGRVGLKLMYGDTGIETSIDAKRIKDGLNLNQVEDLMAGLVSLGKRTLGVSNFVTQKAGQMLNDTHLAISKMSDSQDGVQR